MANMLSIILMVFFTNSCNSNIEQLEKPKSDSEQQVVIASVSRDSIVTGEDIYIGYLDFKLIGDISKKVEKESSQAELKSIGCSTWVLKKEDLKDILLKMRRVDAVEWNAICYTFPCWYTGKVSNGEKEFVITINSASHIILSNNNESIYFVNDKKNNLFLCPCNCCE